MPFTLKGNLKKKLVSYSSKKIETVKKTENVKIEEKVLFYY